MNAIRVTLARSDNTYLHYPCTGLLRVIEYGTNGHIIHATFQVEPQVEQHSAPVMVANPSFEYPARSPA
jgi:hypothetical protein